MRGKFLRTLSFPPLLFRLSSPLLSCGGLSFSYSCSNRVTNSSSFPSHLTTFRIPRFALYSTTSHNISRAIPLSRTRDTPCNDTHTPTTASINRASGFRPPRYGRRKCRPRADCHRHGETTWNRELYLIAGTRLLRVPGQDRFAPRRRNETRFSKRTRQSRARKKRTECLDSGGRRFAKIDLPFFRGYYARFVRAIVT